MIEVIRETSAITGTSLQSASRLSTQKSMA